MILKTVVQTLFTIPEGHDPVVLLGGGTNAENLERAWHDMIPEKFLKDVDKNTSVARLRLHPILVLLVRGKDGHVHALGSLPLQKFQENMIIEDSVEDSKDLRRITDWVAGFISSMCMNDTVSAIDLITEQIILGKEGLVDTLKTIRPKKEVHLESLGDVDDILAGQTVQKETKKEVLSASPQETINRIGEFLTKPDTSKMKRLPVEEKLLEIPGPTTREEIRETNKRTQQQILDKYGWKALKEMSKKMKFTILIEEPHA